MPTELLPSLSLLKGTGGSRSMVYSCHTSLEGWHASTSYLLCSLLGTAWQVGTYAPTCLPEACGFKTADLLGNLFKTLSPGLSLEESDKKWQVW